MTSFLKVGRKWMTDDEVCELIFDNEDIGDDSVDSLEDENETYEEHSGDINYSLKACQIQLIGNEEIDKNNIDLDLSVQDSFVNMINDDTNTGDWIDAESNQALIITNQLDLLDSVPSTSNANQTVPPTQLLTPWNAFPSQFRNIEINCKSSEFDRAIWKKGHLQFNDEQLKFRGDEKLPENVMNLSTPYQIWSYLFPETLEQYIVDETLRYSGIETFSFDKFDLRKYIGVLFYMTYINLPSVRDYWSNQSHRCAHIIQKQMTRNRFEKIREMIHFNDKSKQPSRSDPSRDRLVSTTYC